MATTTYHRSGDDKRGNVRDRARSRENLLRHHGDGRVAPCSYCGRDLTFQTCERDRIDAGGSYRMTNLIPACRSCNARRGDRDALAYAGSISAETFDRVERAILHAATYRPNRRK